MKLIIHGRFVEEDWIARLFHGLIDETIRDEGLTISCDDAIHVVGGNDTPLRDCDAIFARWRSGCNNLSLFHLSDEWYSGGYAAYRHFDRVVRNYPSWFTASPGILTLPLGYANGRCAQGAVRPAGERGKVWSFAGQLKSSRYAMIGAFTGIEPALCHDTAQPGVEGLSGDEYNALLADTIFVPSPMGNVVLESFRTYEALDHGCIPLHERRRAIDYHRAVLGPNPIPEFTSWRKAAQFVEAALAKPGEVAALQQRVHGWWLASIARWQGECARFLRSASFNAELTAFAAKPRNRLRALHEPLRLAELVRHQTPASLGQRMRRNGPAFRRIWRENFGR